MVARAGAPAGAPRAERDLGDADAREFTVELVVTGGPGIDGLSVVEGGLRNLQGVFLVEIERDGRRSRPVRPDEILAAGDRLTFAGHVDADPRPPARCAG